jgi:transcriptional regulator with XRE-family HTH domain
MEAIRVGRILLAVRQDKRLRQRDLGRLAGVGQSVVSRVERGQIDAVTIGTLRKIASALELDLRVELRGRLGDVDRLVDRDHARLVELVVAQLRAEGWEVVVEYSFNHFGERGSVDVVAYHSGLRALLIVEVKTRLTDLQAFLASFGRKLRLVPDLLRAERGWDARAVGRVLVLPGTTANRSVVARHRSVFDVSFPARADAIRRWLRGPMEALAGVWFVSGSRQKATKRVLRVRKPAAPPSEASRGSARTESGAQEEDGHLPVA